MISESLTKRKLFHMFYLNEFYCKLLFTFAGYSPFPFTFFPLIYNALISVGSCSVIYNSRSIAILKLVIPTVKENEILPKLNEMIKMLIELKNGKLLFMKLYYGKSEISSASKVIRIEVIHSS